MKGVGAIDIVTEAITIKLTNVWHVLSIGGNLMWVSRIVHAGYQVEFGPITSHVSKAGDPTILGQRFGSL